MDDILNPQDRLKVYTSIRDKYEECRPTYATIWRMLYLTMLTHGYQELGLKHKTYAHSNELDFQLMNTMFVEYEKWSHINSPHKHLNEPLNKIESLCILDIMIEEVKALC